MTISLFLSLFPASLAFVLGGAHFWRAGYPAFSGICALMALLVWARNAWLRPVLAGSLALLAGRWIWAAGQFVQIRAMMEQPWLRLAAILLGVTAFTLAAALPLLGRAGEARYTQKPQSSRMQACAFGGALFLLFVVQGMAPQVFLVERFLPGWAPLQIFLAGLWCAWVCGGLADAAQAPRVRLRAWRIFSLVFFGQLALGLAGYSQFLMTGQWHIPVPGVILGAPLYRDGGLFMLILFTVSVLLAGSAWCSHLCYFGVWDACAAASRKVTATSPAPPSPFGAWPPARTRLIVLGLTLALPVALRLAGAPTEVALVLALLLGLLLIPCAAFLSRKYGSPLYCLSICPLGQTAVWLGKLAPWRIHRTEACTHCRACVRACRYAAMTDAHLEQKGPGINCTLCRDCLSACRHGGLRLTAYGRIYTQDTVHSAFVVLLSVLHTVFLFLARM